MVKKARSSLKIWGWANWGEHLLERGLNQVQQSPVPESWKPTCHSDRQKRSQTTSCWNVLFTSTSADFLPRSLMYHLVFTSSKTTASESLGIVGNIQDNYSKQLIRIRNKGWAVFLNEEMWHVRSLNHLEVVVVVGWCTRMIWASFHNSICWLSDVVCSRLCSWSPISGHWRKTLVVLLV